MNKLKPCPFCDGELTIKNLGLELNIFKIKCKTSHCISFNVGGGNIDELIKVFNKMAEKEGLLNE